MQQQIQITKDFIQQFIPVDPIILEAGAHIGRDTVKMAKFWPKSKIYCFEPVPDLFLSLQDKIKSYSNITSYDYCLSDQIGPSLFWVSSGRSTALSSIFEPLTGLNSHPETVFETITVHCSTLDRWASDNKISKIDFMWLDMQGAELQALQAGTTILSTVSALLIEVSLIERYKSIPLYITVKNWLQDQGFKIIAQDEPKHGKMNLFLIKWHNRNLLCRK